MMRALGITVSGLMLLALTALAGPSKAGVATVCMRDLLSGPAPQERIYKHTSQGDLRVYVFSPAESKAGERHSAAVWIHGGAWVGGTCESFFPLARYTAARGAVSFVVEYRLVKAGGPVIADCLADCKSAIRYIRAHADELGVDPHRVAALGDSAGGHLAACLGMLEGFDDPEDDRSVSARADALVLYNPCLDLTETNFIKMVIGGSALAKKPAPEALQPKADKLELARKLSPLLQVRSSQSPCLVVHGLADQVVPPEDARRFAAAMRQAGNHCDLKLLEDTPHAFVIPNYKCSEEVVVNALRLADEFLVSLGYLSGEPPLTVSQPPAWRPRVTGVVKARD